MKLSQGIIRSAIQLVSNHKGSSPQVGALKNAVMTAPDIMPGASLRKLEPLVSR